MKPLTNSTCTESGRELLYFMEDNSSAFEHFEFKMHIKLPSGEAQESFQN